MLRLSKAQDSQQERARLNLSESQFLTTTKEGALTLRVGEEGLNLLHDSSDQLLGGGITLGLIGSADAGEEMRNDFAEEGVDEEGETCAVEGV
jgi:hypothetical protein